MIVLVAAALLAAATAPYALPGAKLTPLSGIAVWFLVLLLRAVLMLLFVLILVLYMPTTELFRLFSHLCVHTVVPFLAAHLGFSGHHLGDAAIFVPAIVLAVSVIWAIFALWQGGRAVHSWLRNGVVGQGPRESLIVAGDELVVAAAGIRRPQIVVSAGALAKLDDEELSAGLEHERGHIARRHRYVVVVANLLFALGRFLPGSRRALRELHFQLERDADEYAVHGTGDPLALASVICKVVGQSQLPRPALASVGGSGATTRLGFLLNRGSATPTARGGLAACGLAILLAGFIVALLVVATPSIAQAGLERISTTAPSSYCPS